jgi:SAM-dependent methyltransferase
MKSFKLRGAVEAAILAPQYESKAYVNDYLKVHMTRFTETVSLLATILQPDMRVVDLGSYGSLVPALKDILGVTNITLTEPFQSKKSLSEDSFLHHAQIGEQYSFHVDRFDVEGVFPYSDASFDIVIFTEVLEHLSRDPSQTMSEINRITKMGGCLVLSTPNCASARSVLRILRGGNPNIYPVFQRQPSTDRHNHEYVPWEVRELLKLSGYTLRAFKTVDVYEDQQFGWISKVQIKAMLRIGQILTFRFINARDRGDTIFAVGRKTSGVVERYPGFLYAQAGKPAD